MIKVFISNSIKSDDPTWRKPFKIKDRTVTLNNMQEAIKHIQQDMLDNHLIVLIPENDVDAEKPKKGDTWRVFFGANYKMIGEVEVQEVITKKQNAKRNS